MHGLWLFDLDTNEYEFASGTTPTAGLLEPTAEKINQLEAALLSVKREYLEAKFSGFLAIT